MTPSNRIRTEPIPERRRHKQYNPFRVYPRLDTLFNILIGCALGVVAVFALLRVLGLDW